MSIRCRVVVAGPLSAGVLATLESRFDVESATSSDRDDRTEIVVARADQATQRALLTLLWDTGHTVHTVSGC